jgi:hypothetical protein
MAGKPPYRPFERRAPSPAAPPVAAPAASPRAVPDTRVLGALSALRAERVYQESETCADCEAARLQDGRADALCDRHMGDALGLNSTWGLSGPGRKL